MKKSNLYVIFAALFIVLMIMAGIILLKLGEDEVSAGELYTFPLLIGEKTYLISVRTNYSSVPEVSYSGLLNSVSVNFIGNPENAFCNITIPINLIWGELSVYSQGYKMSKVDHIQSSNSTHNSIYFTFSHPALVKTFDIKGTEGVMELP